MGLLSNGDFLVELAKLFESRANKGSVFLTQKRMTYQAPLSDLITTTPAPSSSGEDAEMTDAEPSASTSTGPAISEGQERSWPCLIRATDGQSKSDTKVKISTLVQPSDYPAFSTKYGAVLKASMTALRKKRKSKRKPAATGEVGFVVRLPKVVGPRRGAGVQKRRRAIKRRERELKKFRERQKRDA